MRAPRLSGIGCSLTLLALLVGCSAPPGGSGTVASSEDRHLKLYIGNGYLAPETVADFEQLTGIAVAVSYFASNEDLEAQLAKGDAGYDVVMSGAATLARQLTAGYYRPLERAKLANYSHLDAQLLGELVSQDAGNQHAIPYLWGTTGIGYNVQKVRTIAGNAPIESWQLVFNPAVASRLASCGIAFAESASDMFSAALSALGKDPSSTERADLQLAAALISKVRPYVRFMDSERQLGNLASGQICVAVMYNGAAIQARDRARENRDGVEIDYVVPKEGSLRWLNTLAIPRDAPHPLNAHLFLDYILRPEVAASLTNYTKYANGDASANSFIDEQLLSDATVYPPEDVRARLVSQKAQSEEGTQLVSRLWTQLARGR